MFDPELIARLAAELDESERSRVQVEHFSKRFPGMTVADGYAVARAWVKMKIARGAVVRGHPANGVGWLANTLAPWDECLEPGEVVLAGSFTRPVAAVAGDTFRGDYGPLGSISFRFV